MFQAAGAKIVENDDKMPEAQKINEGKIDKGKIAVRDGENFVKDARLEFTGTSPLLSEHKPLGAPVIPKTGSFDSSEDEDLEIEDFDDLGELKIVNELGGMGFVSVLQQDYAQMTQAG